MNETSWRTVLWGFLVGIGFRVGWGLVGLILNFLADAAKRMS